MAPTAFATGAPAPFTSGKASPSSCPSCLPRRALPTHGATAARMSASEKSTPTTVEAPVEAPAVSVPETNLVESTEGMTREWIDALQRLRSAVPSSTFEEADTALMSSDGDELEALGLLTEAAKSPIQRKREQAAMDAGGNRVSALKEAQLRRAATGSAREFFKGYVEVAGQHVEQGYVDDSADIMGKLGKKFGGFFGSKKDKESK